MRRNIRKAASVMATLALVMGLMACGSANIPVIGDKAASRGIEETTGIYIDDDAIALSAYAASSTDVEKACSELFDLVNEKRAEKGIRALVWSEALASAAKVRAGELVEEFSHDRPNGTTYWTVNSEKVYAENTAKFYKSASDLCTAWMADESHCANLMNDGYDAIGIAICQTNDGKWYWCAEFGKK